MPERVENLNKFLIELARLLELISRSRDVLFRAPFRANLGEAIGGVIRRLEELAENDYVRNPGDHKEMLAAGLAGPQLELKLESFESALVAFEAEAGAVRLVEVLDPAETILKSLAGAIPGFGSFAEELIEFILKELRKRLRIWR